MREILCAVLLLTGSLLMLFASIGILRFRDAISRAHALAKATTFGMCLMLVGLWLALADEISGLKLLLVIAFILLTVPLASHLICLFFYQQKQTARNRRIPGNETSR